MRIDLSQLATAQIAREHTAERAGDHPLGASDVTGSEDRTTFSSDSGSVGSLVGRAMSSPEIRHELVSQLKQAVSSGQYNLDPNAIASSMLNERG